MKAFASSAVPIVSLAHSFSHDFFHKAVQGQAAESEEEYLVVLLLTMCGGITVGSPKIVPKNHDVSKRGGHMRIEV